MQFVWVRLGDADNYNQFDDLHDAAEYVAELGVKRVERNQTYGVVADGFTGRNYISLFYGDDEAQPTKDVSDQDIQDFNRELAKIRQNELGTTKAE